MKTAVMDLLSRALFNPASTLELAVSAGLAGVVFVIALNKVGNAFNLVMAQTGRSFLSLVLLLAAGSVYGLGCLAILRLFPQVLGCTPAEIQDILDHFKRGVDRLGGRQ